MFCVACWFPQVFVHRFLCPSVFLLERDVARLLIMAHECPGLLAVSDTGLVIMYDGFVFTFSGAILEIPDHLPDVSCFLTVQYFPFPNFLLFLSDQIFDLLVCLLVSWFIVVSVLLCFISLFNSFLNFCGHPHRGLVADLLEADVFICRFADRLTRRPAHTGTVPFYSSLSRVPFTEAFVPLNTYGFCPLFPQPYRQNYYPLR